MSKKNTLLYYSNTIFINISVSKFFYKNPNDIIQIRKIRLHINKSKPNKTHFLYLSLLSNDKLPHLHNFYIPQKFRYQKQRVRRRHGISVFLNKTASYNFMLTLLTELLPFSSSTENEAIKKTKKIWKLTIWQAPLTSQTYRLQSLHGYISIIPITISFHFSNNLTLQHFHFFSFFKIITLSSLSALSE